MRVILQPNLCKIIKEDMRCKKSEKQQNSETNQHTSHFWTQVLEDLLKD